jgi:predicted nuclease of predicted toxin-antitoxin system
MRLLLDENISYRVVKKISTHFPDCESVLRRQEPGLEDRYIWEIAKVERYSIVTFDEDYADLSQLNGFPPKVILLRPVNLTSQEVADLLIRNIESIRHFLTNSDEERGCLQLFDFNKF